MQAVLETTYDETPRSSHRTRGLVRRLRVGIHTAGKSRVYLPDLSRVQASRACGDRLGYLELLRTHNFDVALAERVLALFGL